MLGLSIGVLTLIALAVLIGSMTQTTVGLGLGLVSAPTMTLMSPQLMPDVPIMLAVVLPGLTLLRERRDIDWHGLLWSVPGRLIGTAAGVAVVATVSTATLGLLVGVVVLLAVALTVRTIRIPITRATLITAGLAGGVAGTATSIGGPPFALLYQHRPPRQVRTTMAVYFTTGAAFSLVGLAIAGQVGLREVQVAAALVPVLALGVWAGSMVGRHLPVSVLRPALLVVSALSAASLIVKSTL